MHSQLVLIYLEFREVHLLEPWFNLNKIEQIIGRATRKVSHKMLESFAKCNCLFALRSKRN